jgi:hypothetical protein
LLISKVDIFLLQFRTSPPMDVHKPRQQSTSPPAKFFHLSSIDDDDNDDIDGETPRTSQWPSPSCRD